MSDRSAVRRPLAVLAGLCLAAAVQAVAPGAQALTPRLPEPPPPLGEGEALVYLFRLPEGLPSFRAAHFFVDGRPVVSLKGNGCTVLRVPAGDHRFSQGWTRELREYGGDFGPQHIDARLEPGKTYYYELWSALTGPGTPNSSHFIPTHRVSAEKEMFRCRYAPAADLATPQAATQAADAKAAPSTTPVATSGG